MDADPDKQAENSRRSGIGPGERLQAARIKKGLSVEDVANRMHLSTSILEAIEENNFDEITAPIFVKGYLRAYARIVALSEDEMIEQYLEMYSEEDPPISSTSNVVPELSSTDARIKWTTYFVIALLAVFLAAWWWNKQQNIDAPVSLDVQSSTLAEKASEEVMIGSGIEAGSEAVDAEVVVVDAAAGAPDSSTEPSQSMAADPVPDSSTTLGTVASEIEVVEGEADVEPNEVAMAESDTSAAAPEPVVETLETLETQADSSVSSDAAQSVAATQPEPTPVAEPAQEGTRQRPGRSAPTGSDKLRIVVHADTWADVKDSSNYQMVYDLLRADSTVELTGAAPFSVFLGNGHGVEVLFNGEEFGFSSRIRDDNTARLKIGG